MEDSTGAPAAWVAVMDPSWYVRCVSAVLCVFVRPPKYELLTHGTFFLCVWHEKTGDAYSSLGSTASPFSTSSSPHVSHFPANPRTDWTLTPNSNALLSSTAPTNPAYYDWQHGFGRGAPSHLATFASSSQDGSQWPPQPPLGSQPHGTDAQMLNYSQNQYFMLGENPMFSPQAMSGFGSSFTAPGMALKAMPEDDDLNFLHDGSVPFYDLSSSFSSNGASDTLDAMMLKNPNSTHSPWVMPGDHLGAEGLPCIAGTAGGPSLVEQPLSSPNSWEVSTLVSAPQATVSPKLLRLRPTPTPTSSSESIRTSFLAGNPRDAAASRVASCSGSPSTLSQAMDIDAASSSAPKPRKMLPDRAPRPAHRGRSRDGEGYPNISKSSCRRPPRDSSLPSLRQLGKANAKAKPGSPLCRPLPLLSPAPLKSPRQQPTVAPIFTDPETEERRAKDEFLIESKQKGMTYKQIRLAGGFTEAESTLRGRYRTLTKSREARVRKPEWSTRDVSFFFFLPFLFLPFFFSSFFFFTFILM